MTCQASGESSPCMIFQMSFLQAGEVPKKKITVIVLHVITNMSNSMKSVNYAQMMLAQHHAFFDKERLFAYRPILVVFGLRSSARGPLYRRAPPTHDFAQRRGILRLIGR